MADNKHPDPEVEFSDTKASDAKRSSRNVKIAVIGVLTVVLLLCVVVSVAMYFTLNRKANSTRLAKINLEEGETLTYRVEQDIQIQGGDTQKGTINAVVGIRVLNKTAEEYWFLMKVNLSYVAGNENLRGVKTVIADYFLVRLEVVSSSQTPDGKNGTKESFELYGNKTTDKEFIRFMYRILDQLLPALKKDLYEDVDGKKSERLNPEKSSRIPGAVKMHREANTLDKDALFIKNHFNRSDLVNFTSPIDMNMAYSDRASINKSNGMVTESYAYLAEQMNFGTPIHTKSGYDVTMLNITVFSRVTLIETNGLYFAEAELVRIQLFVKLIAPGAKDPPFNSSHMPSSNDSAFQPTSSPTNGSLARRKRHALQTLFISEIFSKRIELFNKEVIGINISGEAKVWVWKGHNGLEIGVNVILKLGDLTEDVIHYTYLWKAQTRTGDSYDLSWEKEITREIFVYDILLGVSFKLKFDIFIDVTLPWDGSFGTFSFNPIEIKPTGEVVAEIMGWATVWPFSAGARGSGTILKVSLPFRLAYYGTVEEGSHSRFRVQNLCFESRLHLIALKLKASIIYAKWKCERRLLYYIKNIALPIYYPRCYWEDWEEYKSFGEIEAIDETYHLASNCPLPPSFGSIKVKLR